MIPWELLDSVPIPGSADTLQLYKRGREFSIRMAGREIMGSVAHGSEEALVELTWPRIADRVRPRILVGGLGLGYTAAAALRHLGPRGRVVVAELVPGVIRWVRGPLAHLTGDLLRDPRVTVREDDVVKVIRAERQTYDAILLDVDNGPKDLISKGNRRLYAPAGLQTLRAALRPGGVLAVWSAGPDRAFVKDLERAGFQVQEVQARSRGPLGGRQQTIWLAAERSRCASGRLPARRSGKNARSQAPPSGLSEPVVPKIADSRRRRPGPPSGKTNY